MYFINTNNLNNSPTNIVGLHKKFPKIITKKAIDSMKTGADFAETLQSTAVKQSLTTERMYTNNHYKFASKSVIIKYIFISYPDCYGFN